MKIYLLGANLPTNQQLGDALNDTIALSNKLKQFALNLSVDERVNSYKMGARRFAYVKAAERIGRQYEDAMPRQFSPISLTTTVNIIEQLQNIKSIIGQLNEQIDDTLMAARIDAMTYTKQVHDSIKMANAINPAYDTPLKELDEFNTRATTEDNTSTDTNNSTADTNNTGA